MKIKEIKLKNFKAYRDEKLKFSTDKDKNVTLIYGVNGAGKTSFFQALNWGLYGYDVVGKNNTISSMKTIAGKYLLKELSEGETEEIKVEIIFENEGYDYTLTRIAYFSKEAGELVYLMKNDFVSLYYVSDIGKPTLIKNDSQEREQKISRIINNVLPFGSREYFLFDGENLADYSEANKHQSSEIKNAIRQVLGLDDFDIAENNLKKVDDELRKEFVKKECSDIKDRTDRLIQDLKDKQIDIDRKINNSKSELKEKKDDFAKNEDLLKSFEQELEKITARNELEKEIETIKKELADQLKELRSVLTQGYICYSDSIQEKCYDLLTQWRKEDKFPTKYYNLDFVQDILKKKKCFFWDFKEGTEEHKFFLKEQEKLQNWGHNIQNDLTDFYSKISALKRGSKSLLKDINEQHSVYVEMESNLRDKNLALDELNRQIKSKITDSEIQKCNDKRETLKQEMEDLRTDIKSFEESYLSLEKDIKTANTTLESMESKTAEGRVIQHKKKLIGDSIEWLKKLYEHYSQLKREEVEKYMQELFRNILWKKGHYQDAKLTSDYKLVLPDKWGSQGEDLVSKGEGQVLILSFVAALAKSANDDAPFIIDTPFARISIEPTTNIAKFLPEQVTQLVLFVTDKELTSQSEQLFTSKAKYVWTIKFDQETSETNILSGKHVKTEY